MMNSPRDRDDLARIGGARLMNTMRPSGIVLILARDEDGVPTLAVMLEALHKMGPDAQSHLHRIIRESDDWDSRVVAAMMLLLVGDHSRAAIVREAVLVDGRFSGMAANILADRRVEGAEGVIVSRLWNWVSEDAGKANAELAFTLAMAMRRNGLELDDELEAALRNHRVLSPSWEFIMSQED